MPKKKLSKLPNRGVKLLKYWLDGEEKTQHSLCDDISITPQHMCRLLKGSFTPSLPLAVKFEKACGIPCGAWLEDLDGAV